jgi:hypothetical protein
LIYLASPYTHPDPEVREARYKAARRYTGFAMKCGENIFSPVVYGHQFIHLGDKVIPHYFWQDLNTDLILASREVRVLQLAGWENSRGIQHEVDLAEDNFIPVRYVEQFL